MKFKVLVDYSERLSKLSSRNEKTDTIIDLLKTLSTEEALIGVNYIAGRIRQGKLGIIWKGFNELLNLPVEKLDSPSLIAVDEHLEKAKTMHGSEKVRALEPLFARLSRHEREYLISLIVGEVQQGAGEGLVKLAITKLFDLSLEEIERAYLQTPDIAELFTLLSERGKIVVGTVGMRIFSPVRPMLAQIAESMDDVYSLSGDFALEHKLDGIRIQVHRQDDEVKIYSRHLKDITSHFPELVETARHLPIRKFILDGEAVGIDDKGRVVPFQVLARRTTRKKDITTMQKQIPVLPQFFDALYVDGDDLTNQTYIERIKALAEVVRDKDYLTARIEPISKDQAISFYNASLQKGNEGIMVKMLDSTYRPGRRGNLWFKLKAAHTIDCVILGAEWGHGRRQGMLSNLHLGVLDETKSKYLMVGKTFKGLTDKMLIWLTRNLPRYAVHEDKWTVYLEPEVVVEIAFNEVQKSPRYESGVALRFARVKKIRTDKTAKEINTILDLEKFSRIALNGSA